ncbi:MAG: molecular chaperone Tir [Cyclobacteriaceae bacterium]|nr:molecular chaperone Tir [Cyclobacteriaceae bacterium]
MNNYFSKVKDYLLELDYTISYEDENDGVLVVGNEANGINNLVLGVADPLLIIEQFIFEFDKPTAEMLTRLMQKSRDIIHGAFVLDETGKRVIFRNTHELENLDLNEIEATLNSLSLLLSEYSTEIIELSKN